MYGDVHVLSNDIKLQEKNCTLINKHAIHSTPHHDFRPWLVYKYWYTKYKRLKHPTPHPTPQNA